jgi:hypothetical protein
MAFPRILLNDPTQPSALRVFRDNVSVEANGPYVAAVSPSAGSAGNNPATPITALIADGAATVATSGVKLLLNGNPVTPQSLTKADGKISVTYNPDPARTTAGNAVRLEYTDSSSALRTGELELRHRGLRWFQQPVGWPVGLRLR